MIIMGQQRFQGECGHCGYIAHSVKSMQKHMAQHEENPGYGDQVGEQEMNQEDVTEMQSKDKPGEDINQELERKTHEETVKFEENHLGKNNTDCSPKCETEEPKRVRRSLRSKIHEICMNAVKKRERKTSENSSPQRFTTVKKEPEETDSKNPRNVLLNESKERPEIQKSVISAKKKSVENSKQHPEEKERCIIPGRRGKYLNWLEPSDFEVTSQKSFNVIENCAKRMSTRHGGKRQQNENAEDLVYQCTYNGCRTVFTSRSLFCSHVVVAHGPDGARLYYCTFCSFVALSRETVQEHVRSSHPEHRLPANEADEKEKSKVKDTEETSNSMDQRGFLDDAIESYYCTWCDHCSLSMDKAEWHFFVNHAGKVPSNGEDIICRTIKGCVYRHKKTPKFDKERKGPKFKSGTGAKKSPDGSTSASDVKKSPDGSAPASDSKKSPDGSVPASDSKKSPDGSPHALDTKKSPDGLYTIVKLKKSTARKSTTKKTARKSLRTMPMPPVFTTPSYSYDSDVHEDEIDYRYVSDPPIIVKQEWEEMEGDDESEVFENIGTGFGESYLKEEPDDADENVIDLDRFGYEVAIEPVVLATLDGSPSQLEVEPHNIVPQPEFLDQDDVLEVEQNIRPYEDLRNPVYAMSGGPVSEAHQPSVLAGSLPALSTVNSANLINSNSGSWASEQLINGSIHTSSVVKNETSVAMNGVTFAMPSTVMQPEEAFSTVTMMSPDQTLATFTSRTMPSTTQTPLLSIPVNSSTALQPPQSVDLSGMTWPTANMTVPQPDVALSQSGTGGVISGAVVGSGLQTPSPGILITKNTAGAVAQLGLESLHGTPVMSTLQCSSPNVASFPLSSPTIMTPSVPFASSLSSVNQTLPTLVAMPQMTVATSTPQQASTHVSLRSLLSPVETAVNPNISLPSAPAILSPTLLNTIQRSPTSMKLPVALPTLYPSPPRPVVSQSVITSPLTVASQTIAPAVSEIYSPSLLPASATTRLPLPSPVITSLGQASTLPLGAMPVQSPVVNSPAVPLSMAPLPVLHAATSLQSLRLKVAGSTTTASVASRPMPSLKPIPIAPRAQVNPNIPCGAAVLGKGGTESDIDKNYVVAGPPTASNPVLYQINLTNGNALLINRDQLKQLAVTGKFNIAPAVKQAAMGATLPGPQNSAAVGGAELGVEGSATIGITEIRPQASVLRSPLPPTSVRPTLRHDPKKTKTVFITTQPTPRVILPPADTNVTGSNSVKDLLLVCNKSPHLTVGQSPPSKNGNHTTVRDLLDAKKLKKLNELQKSDDDASPSCPASKPPDLSDVGNTSPDGRHDERVQENVDVSGTSAEVDDSEGFMPRIMSVYSEGSPNKTFEISEETVEDNYFVSVGDMSGYLDDESEKLTDLNDKNGIASDSADHSYSSPNASVGDVNSVDKVDDELIKKEIDNPDAKSTSSVRTSGRERRKANRCICDECCGRFPKKRRKVATPTDHEYLETLPEEDKTELKEEFSSDIEDFYGVDDVPEDFLEQKLQKDERISKFWSTQNHFPDDDYRPPWRLCTKKNGEKDVHPRKKARVRLKKKLKNIVNTIRVDGETASGQNKSPPTYTVEIKNELRNKQVKNQVQSRYKTDSMIMKKKMMTVLSKKSKKDQTVEDGSPGGNVDSSPDLVKDEESCLVGSGDHDCEEKTSDMQVMSTVARCSLDSVPEESSASEVDVDAALHSSCHDAKLRLKPVVVIPDIANLVPSRLWQFATS